MITLAALYYHSKNTGGRRYVVYMRNYIRDRYKLPIKSDEKLMECIRRTANLVHPELPLPGAYDIDLNKHAVHVRRYFNIHKSAAAREAYLMCLANRDNNIIIDFNHLPVFFHQN